KQHPADKGRYDDAAASPDALAGIFRTVSHKLFGRGIDGRHRHRWDLLRCASVVAAVSWRAARQPPGFSRRPATTVSTTSAMRSSPTRTAPFASAVTTTG